MNTETATKKVVGYVRVSTTEQAQSGLSIEAQTHAITEYAARVNLAPPEILVEAESGKNLTGRPILTAILADMQAGEVATLIVWRQDRAFRNTIDALVAAREFQRSGCQLLSVTDAIDLDTPDGELIYTFKAALGQYERRQIALRTKVALEAAKRRGTKVGRTPIGFTRLSKTAFEPNNTIEAVRQIQALSAAGRSTRAIATTLNEQGIQAPAGGIWRHSTVAYILKSPAYTEVTA